MASLQDLGRGGCVNPKARCLKQLGDVGRAAVGQHDVILFFHKTDQFANRAKSINHGDIFKLIGGNAVFIGAHDPLIGV